MVLSGNSTQANCTRSNSVVALSGKEQISPALLLSDNAPSQDHNEIEQSCMSGVLRTSLRNRRKPVSEKQCTPTSFVNEKKQVSDDTSAYLSLLPFLPKNSPPSLSTSLILKKNHPCPECHQAFPSKSGCARHVLTTHKTKNLSNPLPTNGVVHQKQTVISANKSKRQSSEDRHSSKRMKRSQSRERCFSFNPELMCCSLDNGDKIFKCDICEQTFALKSAGEVQLKIHYLKCHINYEFISAQDRTLYSIVEDGSKNSNSIQSDHLYRCYFCNVSYGEKHLLIKHTLGHRNVIHRCDTCNAVFLEKEAFINHVKSCGKSSEPSSSNSCEETPVSSFCLFCKDLKTVQNTEVDKANHRREFHVYVNGVVNRKCLYGCSTKFKNMADLYKHYASVHRKVYFSCVSCKIRFRSADELISHNFKLHGSLKLTNGQTKLCSSASTSVKSCSLSPFSTCSLNGQDKSSNNKVSGTKVTGVIKSKVSPKPRSSCESLSAQQKHFLLVFLKEITKIDIVEQVRVLKKHAKQYPDIFKLPKNELFDTIKDSEPIQFLDEEDFVRPVFSSPQQEYVYTCKTCGFQCSDLNTMIKHFDTEHPFIQNEYFEFEKNNLPEDLWSLHTRNINKVKVSNGISKTNSCKTKAYKCTCCPFETKHTFDFHKHLLQCAIKHKHSVEVGSISKSLIKKEESASEKQRRRMAITGILREVPDDPLFSYKLQLEKTINKPGDSETVFNMLNKLPSKRLVKTTERYDSLQYKSNKALKPKRNPCEKNISNGNVSFNSLNDYLKNFIHKEVIEKTSLPSPPSSVIVPTEETKAKAKVVKISTNEEPTKIIVEKKAKVIKSEPVEDIKPMLLNQKKIKVTKANLKLTSDQKLKISKPKNTLDSLNKPVTIEKKTPKLNTDEDVKIKKVKLFKANELSEINKSKLVEFDEKLKVPSIESTKKHSSKSTSDKSKVSKCKSEPAEKKRKTNDVKVVDLIKQKSNKDELSLKLPGESIVQNGKVEASNTVVTITNDSQSKTMKIKKNSTKFPTTRTSEEDNFFQNLNSTKIKCSKSSKSKLSNDITTQPKVQNRKIKVVDTKMKKGITLKVGNSKLVKTKTKSNCDKPKKKHGVKKKDGAANSHFISAFDSNG